MSRSRIREAPVTEVDRRRTYRYAPTVKNLILGWGWGDSRVELPVELECVSLHGCRVRSRGRPVPNPGQSIWLKASSLDGSNWIEGRIVSSQKPFLRKHEIRILFVSNLPFHLFKMLVYGNDVTAPDPEPTQRPEHETDQWWR